MVVVVLAVETGLFVVTTGLLVLFMAVFVVDEERTMSLNEILNCGGADVAVVVVLLVVVAEDATTGLRGADFVLLSTTPFVFMMAAAHDGFDLLFEAVVEAATTGCLLVLVL